MESGARIVLLTAEHNGSAAYGMIRNPLPAGLRGLWPSHRNNAKHGLSALPHPFRTTAPNHYKTSKSLNLKVLLDFFQKIVGSRGKAPVARRNGRNTRAAHGAKHSPAAAGETPQASQSAIRRWRNPRPRAMVRAAAPAGWTAWTINQRRTGYRPLQFGCSVVHPGGVGQVPPYRGGKHWPVWCFLAHTDWPGRNRFGSKFTT